MQNKFKKYLLTFLLLQLLLAYSPVFAQTADDYTQGNTNPVSSQIEKYLCSPNPVPTSQSSLTNGIGTGLTQFSADAAANNNNSTILYQCINQLYKFAIIVASVMSVFFIVIAGYVYMSAEGNSESVDKAKNILTTSIASLVILFGGYILLKAINPDLIQFHSIQPPSVVGGAVGATPVTGGAPGVTTPMQGGSITGNGRVYTYGSGMCVPIADPNSPVSVPNLQNTCLKANASLFSAIADEETGGGRAFKSGSDKCADNNSVSIGWFQINLTASPLAVNGVPCSSAFSKPYTSKDQSCVVVNQSLYQQCVTAALDPNQNIQTACQMSNNGTNLTPWNTSCFNKWVSN